MGIGKRLKEARERKGLTQRELGKIVGVTGSAITNYENEVSHPKETVMYALINALEVEPNFLFQDCVKISSKKDPPMSGRAIKLAQSFDKLDDAGKDFLEDSLKREEKRMDAESALEESIKAFANSFTMLRIYKTPISDKSGIDLAEDPEPKMIKITKKTPEEQASVIRRVMMINNPFGIRFRYDDGKEIIFAIDGDSVAGPGQAGLFIFDGKSFLKRLEYDGLYPVQPGQDPIPVPDVPQRAGRVIGWFETDCVGDVDGINLQF